MDVFEAIRTLLAVRRYRDKPVPEDVVRRVLEAGRLSASANRDGSIATTIASGASEKYGPV